MSKYIGVASSSGGFKNLYKQFQSFIFRVDADDSADVIDAEYGTQGYWRTITDRLSQSPEVAVKKANFRPLQYFTDLGGFYPSPPPKWPKHIVYAIMDAFLENMPYLLQSDGKAHLHPITMASTLNTRVHNLTLKISDSVVLKEVDSEDVKPIIEGKWSKETLVKLLGKENYANLADRMGGESSKDQQRRIAKLVRQATLDALSDDKNSLNKTTTVTYNTDGPKSILEMAYDVAEISKSKYNQSLIGDDFKFVMAMLDVSIHALNESTDPGDFTAENFTKYLSGVLGAKRGEELNRLREKLAESDIEGDEEALQFRTILMAQLMLIRNDIEERLPTMSEDERKVELAELNDQKLAITNDSSMDMRLKLGLIEYIQGTIDMVR